VARSFFMAHGVETMHASECDIQLCYHKVHMSAAGQSPSVDISTEGQHISISHELPCFICFVI